MSGQGGYLVEQQDVDAPVALLSPSYSGTSHSASRSEPEPLLRLTPRQEGRLRAHLDDKLLGLERDERKNAFGSLPALIARLTPILHLILQIPPPEPWSALRISYLLSFTGSITTYLSSLPLLSASSHFYAHAQPAVRSPTRLGAGVGDGSQSQPPQSPASASDVSASLSSPDPQVVAGRTMRQVLDLLNLVDKGWQAVLRGEAWVPPLELGGEAKAIKVGFAGQVGQTERIRLRSIIIAARAKMLAWARTYGQFRGASLPSSSQNGAVQNESLSSGFGEADEVTADVGPGWEWENEILGMWNGILGVLVDDEHGED